MSRPRTPDDEIPHGTPAGYLHHQRYLIPHGVCGGSCRRAWSDRQRDYRRNHPNA